MKLTTKLRRNQLVNHYWLSNIAGMHAGTYCRNEIVSENYKKEN